MSQFDELWQEIAAPTLAEAFAGEAICTPPGGQPLAIVMVSGPLETIEQNTADGIVRKLTRTIIVPRTAAAAAGGGYLAAPGMDDAWQIAGDDYAVESIVAQDDSETLLRLVRRAIRERTREGLRRKSG